MVTAKELVISEGVDKILGDVDTRSCLSFPKKIIGLSSPTAICKTSYYSYLNEKMKTFRTAF
ncbi:hypothetical protein [Candidatus Mycoplasma haematohominis]|uniref:Uncharacterized protein n=1 Tax=Candidatus Mycoplasma haematohominis TaxID=1494318 RepID=A0A478FQT4_9MOLU|nr:hypothetical protein [Candidatus Mycoplasma haemohominis]GCE63843.1 hypothetical protein MHSWG343_08500 [Candidatus Mycoplasma haemohominis]